MLELIRLLVCELEIKDINSANVLVFKGLYALPTETGFFAQFRFRKALRQTKKEE